MIYHEDNIYETIGHVSNLQNDCCSDQFTERSVSTSDISQSSSENYHSNRMTGTNKTKNIQTQMNFTIHTVREGATVRAGDEINVYFPNDLKCKKTLTMAVLVGILLCSILILTKILFSSSMLNKKLIKCVNCWKITFESFMFEQTTDNRFIVSFFSI